MKEITIRKIVWPSFTKEEFNNILIKNYDVIKNNDTIFVLDERRVEKEELCFILDAIEECCDNRNIIKKEDVKGLSHCFICSPFIVEPELMAKILGYYFHKMMGYFDLEMLMGCKQFNDFEYYRNRAKQLYDILRDEDIEKNIYYIELVNYR